MSRNAGIVEEDMERVLVRDKFADRGNIRDVYRDAFS